MRAVLLAREVSEMRRARATGAGLAELARAYACSPSAVAYHCRDIPAPPTVRQAIGDLLRQDLDIRLIAARLGKSVGNIRAVRSRLRAQGAVS